MQRPRPRTLGERTYTSLADAHYSRLVDHWFGFAPTVLECGGDAALEDRVLRNNSVGARARHNYNTLARNIREREEAARVAIVADVAGDGSDAAAFT